MAEESHLVEAGNDTKKRSRHPKGKKAKKKQRMVEKIKIDKKLRKLFQKRAREYNSDDDEPSMAAESEILLSSEKDEVAEGNSDVDDAEVEVSEGEGEGEGEGEEDGVQPGITKFTEGCRAFRIAFKKITKENLTDDPLAKRLLAENLAEEESEQKVKGESKKEKKLVQEKGHVKPDKFLDSHEKFLISVATKGVVKLFNAGSSCLK